MNKLTSTSIVKISVNIEVLLENGNQEVMTLSHEINIQQLIAMGYFLQKDLLDELKSELEQAFIKKDEAIAILDEYTVVNIISYGIDSNQSYSYEFRLYGDEFIPEFRGLYGITY